jgi:hypothetical protein
MIGKAKYILPLMLLFSAFGLVVMFTPTASAPINANNNSPKFSTVWREYPYIPPHLVQNSTHYVYVTDWGNWLVLVLDSNINQFYPYLFNHF